MRTSKHFAFNQCAQGLKFAYCENKFFALNLFIVHLLGATATFYANNEHITTATTYLSKYGYLSPKFADSTSADLITQELFTEAVKKFQKFLRLNATGVLDEKTLKLLETPRCGVPDEVYDENERSKRHILVGTHWNKTVLTYYISNYSKEIDQYMNRSQVKIDLQKAFDMWSEWVNLDLQLTESMDADIIIYWGVRDHGDIYPFDGKSGTLAHAFFPGADIGGDTHFDDDEMWTTGTKNGKNLLLIAAHEFGHALGLGHSNVLGSIMEPYCLGYDPDYILHEDDILGMQKLYGAKKLLSTRISTTTTTTTTTPSHPPPTTTVSTTTSHITRTPTWSQEPTTNKRKRKRLKTLPPNTNPYNVNQLCNVFGKMDTMFSDPERKTYIFVGEEYWEITRHGIAKGYPKKIYQRWRNLPNDLDAALNYNDCSYFFKDQKFWIYKEYRMETGYPKYISNEFKGIPDKINAVFFWKENLYFFKGAQYWEYNTQLSYTNSVVAKPITEWKRFPKGITAAFKYINNKHYVIKQEKYYRISKNVKSVDNDRNSPFPRLFKDWWLDCPYPPKRRRMKL